jgi:diguanylate cyclase (GGDEF)-like protein
MISLKKFLDSAQAEGEARGALGEEDILSAAMAAYGAALLAMGNCSLDACPALGEDLKRNLGRLEEKLSVEMSAGAIEATDNAAQELLREWGRRTARHYEEKAGEVKELLIVMARTGESVGARDQRCAGQINEVTARLESIASLEDLTEIRASIEKSAAELKTSIGRMAEEGKAAVAQLRLEVRKYEAKLEEAEEIASRDALTGLRSRVWVENQIERRIGTGTALCVAILDIDGFKKVNDEHGHLTGDELLRQFAKELQSACRSTDLIGRWGGDEFIILLDCGMCGMREASAQADRLREWFCGSYTVQGRSGVRKLRLDASIGLAEHLRGEAMKELIARADEAMYAHKAASHAKGNAAGR